MRSAIEDRLDGGIVMRRRRWSRAVGSASATLVGVAGLCACLPIVLCALPARADVVFSTDQTYYEIGANEETRGAIWQGVRKWGPSVDGERAIGMATGSVRWSYKFKRVPDGCQLDQFRVFVNVRLMLPTWRLENSAHQDISRYWQCVKRTVTIHEEGHAEIWRRTGRRIDWAVNQMRDVVVPCGEVQQRVQAIAQPIYERGREQQSIFDAEDRRRKRYLACDRNPVSANHQPAILPVWHDDDTRRTVQGYQITARQQQEERSAAETRAKRNFGEQPARVRAAPPEAPEPPSARTPEPAWISQLGAHTVSLIAASVALLFVGAAVMRNAGSRRAREDQSRGDHAAPAPTASAMQAALDRAIATRAERPATTARPANARVPRPGPPRSAPKGFGRRVARTPTG